MRNAIRFPIGVAVLIVLTNSCWADQRVSLWCYRTTSETGTDEFCDCSELAILIRGEIHRLSPFATVQVHSDPNQLFNCLSQSDPSAANVLLRVGAPMSMERVSGVAFHALYGPSVVSWPEGAFYIPRSSMDLEVLGGLVASPNSPCGPEHSDWDEIGFGIVTDTLLDVATMKSRAFRGQGLEQNYAAAYMSAPDSHFTGISSDALGCLEWTYRLMDGRRTVIPLAADRLLSRIKSLIPSDDELSAHAVQMTNPVPTSQTRAAAKVKSVFSEAIPDVYPVGFTKSSGSTPSINKKVLQVLNSVACSLGVSALRQGFTMDQLSPVINMGDLSVYTENILAHYMCLGLLLEDILLVGLDDFVVEDSFSIDSPSEGYPQPRFEFRPYLNTGIPPSSALYSLDERLMVSVLSSQGPQLEFAKAEVVELPRREDGGEEGTPSFIEDVRIMSVSALCFLAVLGLPGRDLGSPSFCELKDAVSENGRPLLVDLEALAYRIAQLRVVGGSIQSTNPKPDDVAGQGGNSMVPYRTWVLLAKNIKHEKPVTLHSYVHASNDMGSVHYIDSVHQHVSSAHQHARGSIGLSLCLDSQMPVSGPIYVKAKSSEPRQLEPGEIPTIDSDDSFEPTEYEPTASEATVAPKEAVLTWHHVGSTVVQPLRLGMDLRFSDRGHELVHGMFGFGNLGGRVPVSVSMDIQSYTETNSGEGVTSTHWRRFVRPTVPDLELLYVKNSFMGSSTLYDASRAFETFGELEPASAWVRGRHTRTGKEFRFLVHLKTRSLPTGTVGRPSANVEEPEEQMAASSEARATSPTSAPGILIIDLMYRHIVIPGDNVAGDPALSALSPVVALDSIRIIDPFSDTGTLSWLNDRDTPSSLQEEILHQEMTETDVQAFLNGIEISVSLDRGSHPHEGYARYVVDVATKSSVIDEEIEKSDSFNDFVALLTPGAENAMQVDSDVLERSESAEKDDLDDTVLGKRTRSAEGAAQLDVKASRREAGAANPHALVRAVSPVIGGIMHTPLGHVIRLLDATDICGSGWPCTMALSVIDQMKTDLGQIAPLNRFQFIHYRESRFTDPPNTLRARYGLIGPFDSHGPTARMTETANAVAVSVASVLNAASDLVGEQGSYSRVTRDGVNMVDVWEITWDWTLIRQILLKNEDEIFMGNRETTEDEDASSSDEDASSSDEDSSSSRFPRSGQASDGYMPAQYLRTDLSAAAVVDTATGFAKTLARMKLMDVTRVKLMDVARAKLMDVTRVQQIGVTRVEQIGVASPSNTGRSIFSRPGIVQKSASWPLFGGSVVSTSGDEWFSKWVHQSIKRENLRADCFARIRLEALGGSAGPLRLDGGPSVSDLLTNWGFNYIESNDECSFLAADDVQDVFHDAMAVFAGNDWYSNYLVLFTKLVNAQLHDLKDNLCAAMVTAYFAQLVEMQVLHDPPQRFPEFASTINTMSRILRKETRTAKQDEEALASDLRHLFSIIGTRPGPSQLGLSRTAAAHAHRVHEPRGIQYSEMARQLPKILLGQVDLLFMSLEESQEALATIESFLDVVELYTNERVASNVRMAAEGASRVSSGEIHDVSPKLPGIIIPATRVATLLQLHVSTYKHVSAYLRTQGVGLKSEESCGLNEFFIEPLSKALDSNWSPPSTGEPLTPEESTLLAAALERCIETLRTRISRIELETMWYKIHRLEAAIQLLTSWKVSISRDGICSNDDLNFDVMKQGVFEALHFLPDSPIKDSAIVAQAYLLCDIQSIFVRAMESMSAFRLYAGSVPNSELVRFRNRVHKQLMDVLQSEDFDRTLTHFFPFDELIFALARHKVNLGTP